MTMAEFTIYLRATFITLNNDDTATTKPLEGNCIDKLLNSLSFCFGPIVIIITIFHSNTTTINKP